MAIHRKAGPPMPEPNTALGRGVWIETALSDGGRRVAFAVDGQGRKVATAVIPTDADRRAIVELLSAVLILHEDARPALQVLE